MNRIAAAALAALLCLALVRQPAAQEPAAPEWLSRLFPHTGQPDRLEHRLRRIEARQAEVNGRALGVVTVELTYRGLDGREETGRARIYLPASVRLNPSRRLPLLHGAGYTVDERGAAAMTAKGYAVSTPFGHPLNPLGRGANLDRAILHAARRLPFVDPLRVSVQGGSAGGWMALMVAADAFPLVWAMPDVPPIHLGYNAAYIHEQQALAAAPAGGGTPRMPVLLAVGGIAAQMKTLYGVPFDSPAYLAASPLAHLDTVTAPTLVTFSTADMLVPVNQVGPKHVRPHDSSAFPDGFTTALTERFPGVGGKRTLLEALPRARYEQYRIPPPAKPTRLGTQGPPAQVTLPFSREKPWSIVVIDEGPVEPAVGHFKYAWALDREPFLRWAEERGVTADQLTAPKLRRLMMRVKGQPWRPLRIRPGEKGEEIAGNLLDYPEAERADVLLGLSAFAADDTRAIHLGRLYAGLPGELKVLGDRLGDGTAAGTRSALAGTHSAPSASPR
jgi:hypothetical protein